MQSALVPSLARCKRLGGGGIGACVCESARVVRANPRPCSRLPCPSWTMANRVGWKLELHNALELADELLAQPRMLKDPAMLLSGNCARGTTLLELGELVSANEHLEKALAVFDLRQPLSAQVEVAEVRVRSGTCTLASTDLAIPIVPGRNRARCWRWLSGLPLLSFWLQLPACGQSQLAEWGRPSRAKARRRGDGAHRRDGTPSLSAVGDQR